MNVAQEWPDGTFDLIVLSEIGYYAPDPLPLAQRLLSSLRSDGVVAVCSWRHPVMEHRVTADAVHDAVRRHSGLHLLATHQEEDFLLDVLSVDGISVARADGLVD